MIVPGSGSQSLAASLADATGEPLAPVEFDRFADGELLARVPGFEGDRAVVVAATDSSDAHVELLQLQDAVADRADASTASNGTSKNSPTPGSWGFTTRTRSVPVAMARAIARAETGSPSRNRSSWRV